MPPPRNDNPFLIPSLIPPLTTSSTVGIKNMGSKANDRNSNPSNSLNIGNNKNSENEKQNKITTVNSSLLLYQPLKQKQNKFSKATNKFLILSSNNVINNNNSHQSHGLPRVNLKLARRKALSPIDMTPQLSSSSSLNRKHIKSNNYSLSSSPSLTPPAPPPAMPVLASLSSAATLNRTRQQRVLLFGETIDSLFCLKNIGNVDDKHYQLCQAIVDGTCSDDPGAWRRVIEMARNPFDNPITSGSNSKRDDLIRLHRRATLRFSLSNQQNFEEGSQFPSSSSSSSLTITMRRRNIFEIWLSFAKIHAEFKNLEESRRTFRFIENNQSMLLDFPFLATKHTEEIGSAAKFYLSYADFESRCCGNKDAAKQILCKGMKQRAEPIQKLNETFISLGGSQTDLKDGFVKRQFNTSNGINVTEDQKHTPASRRDCTIRINERDHITTPGSKRVNSDDNSSLVSPKRRNMSLREFSTPRVGQPCGSVSESRRQNENEGICIKTYNKQLLSTASKKSKQKFTQASSNGLHETAVNTPLSSTIKRSTSNGKPPVMKKRPSLTSRLKGKGLSGKATRVDCTINLEDDDSSSDEDTIHDKSCALQDTDEFSAPFKHKESLSSSKPSEPGSKKSSRVPSFKKLDLSYMWAWDPSAKGKDPKQCLEKPSDATNSTGSGQSTIATQGSGDSSSGEVSASAAHVTNQKPEQSQTFNRKKEEIERCIPSVTEGVPNNDSTDKDKKKNDHDSEKHLQLNPQMSRRQELVAKANLEFLPLVYEDNIIKVHGSTYAKLGVIGKGGSCKVYRALSKKCSVVAIKRVKLAGMDAKAIEGYANEISLLKRLRGNPAIIQMYDSEVDLQRKSIFVVMEVGEVDLNQVLQQRALSKTSRSLNMNFIRLTWQQMLSAVHCIHEERIIHSDLKPANFLFVRGALKLIDFGIAKAIVNDDTTNIYRENHIGTLNYMSPEAILDTGSGHDGPRMKIGRASDVWSLGCILYEMVYGQTPFSKLHFIQKLQAIVNPSHAIQFPYDEEADAAIDAMKQCLCRNPEERPPIIGKNGLLNEHWFLHSRRAPRSS